MANKKELYIDGDIVSVGLQNIDKDDKDIAITFEDHDKIYTVYIDGYEFLKWFNKEMIKEIKTRLNKYIKKI